MEDNYLLSELNLSNVILQKLNLASDSIIIISENHCSKCITKTLTLINEGSTVITNYSSDLKAKRTVDPYHFYNFKNEIFNDKSFMEFSYPLLLVRNSGKYWKLYVIDDNFIVRHD
jgi:hypothetical protein